MHARRQKKGKMQETSPQYERKAKPCVYFFRNRLRQARSIHSLSKCDNTWLLHALHFGFGFGIKI